MTSSFDQELPIMGIYFFKIGLVMHICWTVLMFSEPYLLTIDLQAQIQILDVELSIGNNDKGFFTGKRFFSGVGILYIFYIVVLLVLYILRNTLIRFLSKICENVSLFKKYSISKESDSLKHDILVDLRIETLIDLYKKTLNDFEDVNN